MTCQWRQPQPAVAELTDGDLGDALLAGAIGEPWTQRAAVGLLVTHQRWLARDELRQAIETNASPDGDLAAWVLWERVDLTAAAKPPDDVRLLALACSLGGATNRRPLSDLLRDLDDTNAALVLNAVWVACTGHPLTRAKDLWW